MGTELLSAPRGPEPTGKLLWNIEEVAAKVGFGERTLWKWVSSGTFPAPDIKRGTKVRRWRPATIEAWVNGQGEVSK